MNKMNELSSSRRKKYNGLSARLLGPLFRGDEKRKLMLHRATVLFITFIVYMVYHMSRRPLSIVKATLHRNCTEYNAQNNIQSDSETSCNWEPFDQKNGKELLGLMDTCFLASYAVFMFVAGYAAERSNLRYFISFSLAICGVLCIGFGLALPLQIHSIYFFVLIQLISGVFQTTGWPAVVAVIGPWFGSSKKGFIFGIWSLHTSLGNILGATVAGAFVDTYWGFSFFVPGFICIGVAIIVFLFLVPKPSDAGIEIEISCDELATTNDVNNNQSSIKSDTKYKSQNENTNDEAISIWGALRIPGVIDFSICLFFTKLVSYTFLYWLPVYLEETSHYTSSKSAYASIMFDIGGSIGSILAGLMADKTGASGLTCILFLGMAIPSLYSFYLWSKISTLTNQILQFIAGFFINAPYSLITTAVSANLACKVPSKSAMATVSAIIDGTGSIGAAIGPSLAGWGSEIGWIYVFYMTMAADLIALLLLIRIGYQEYCHIKTRQ